VRPSLACHLPILEWARRYDRSSLARDLLAAVVVTIMLIPQSLAYAMLAGLPPEVGLYASIAPLVLYSVLGSSRTLAVGPVAVVSLITAAALGEVAAQGTTSYAAAALTLAALSGAFLLAMGLLRLGLVASFLSYPVVAGFITASGLLIAASQLRHILGVEAHGHTLPVILGSLAENLSAASPWTLAIGLGATAFLLWVRKGARPALIRLGVPPGAAAHLAKAGPVLAVAATTALVWGLSLDARGVAIVGEVPAALPPLTLPPLAPSLVAQLAVPALLISVVGFVESVSVAQTLAAKRRQRIDPDQELLGLGAANLGAAFTGGYPVTGGFARSVVNFDAGAETPAAGFFTAAGIALAAVALTPLLHDLPRATLGATILVAVLSLVDLSVLRTAWRTSKPDFAAAMATIGATLLAGVEAGISAGVLVSIGLHLWRTARPHAAEVGLVPGTQHFRNVERHAVLTDPAVLTIRIDESLYFPNARWLEDMVLARAADRPDLRHVVLMCPAVNAVDLSGLEALEALNRILDERGTTLHLSEVKGPVMDWLRRAEFLEHLTGRVFLSQWDALEALSPQIARTEDRHPQPGESPLETV
jgi:SulP family sulfate permease